MAIKACDVLISSAAVSNSGSNTRSSGKRGSNETIVVIFGGVDVGFYVSYYIVYLNVLYEYCRNRAGVFVGLHVGIFNDLGDIEPSVFSNLPVTVSEASADLLVRRIPESDEWLKNLWGRISKNTPAIRTLTYDAADFLTDEETIAAYLTESLESDDPKVIAKALGAVARARGMTQLSKDTGITREALYRALTATGNHFHAIRTFDQFGCRTALR